MGRKSKADNVLTKENLTRIKGWAMDGLSDEQIAKNIGIAWSTLKVWKKKYSALSTALKKSKDVADREVENAMFKAALGYFVEETKKVIETKEDGSTITREETTKKWMPPNPTLAIFWSKNRKPAEWRDKQDFDLNHKGKVESSVNHTFSRERLRELLNDTE